MINSDDPYVVPETTNDLGAQDLNANETPDDDIGAKEQIIHLVAMLKDTASQELNYFKLRTGYSLRVIAKGSAAIVAAILFVLVAFMSLGLGILIILKPVMGAIWATVLTVVIFLTLSILMAGIGKYYFKRLSFPELSQNEMNVDKEHE